MVQLIQTSGQGMNPSASLRSERVDIITVAKRMFNEGFKRSTILRITGLNEDEFTGLMRDLHMAGRTRMA